MDGKLIVEMQSLSLSVPHPHAHRVYLSYSVQTLSQAARRQVAYWPQNEIEMMMMMNVCVCDLRTAHSTIANHLDKPLKQLSSCGRYISPAAHLIFFANRPNRN